MHAGNRSVSSVRTWIKKKTDARGDHSRAQGFCFLPSLFLLPIPTACLCVSIFYFLLFLPCLIFSNFFPSVFFFIRLSSLFLMQSVYFNKSVGNALTDGQKYRPRFIQKLVSRPGDFSDFHWLPAAMLSLSVRVSLSLHLITSGQDGGLTTTMTAQTSTLTSKRPEMMRLTGHLSPRTTRISRG